MSETPHTHTTASGSLPITQTALVRRHTPCVVFSCLLCRIVSVQQTGNHTKVWMPAGVRRRDYCIILQQPQTWARNTLVFPEISIANTQHSEVTHLLRHLRRQLQLNNKCLEHTQPQKRKQSELGFCNQKWKEQKDFCQSLWFQKRGKRNDRSLTSFGSKEPLLGENKFLDFGPKWILFAEKNFLGKRIREMPKLYISLCFGHRTPSEKFAMGKVEGLEASEATFCT